MVERLKQAFAMAEQRPEQEHEALAALLLEEVRVEERWDRLLADPRSGNLLDRLVAEAIKEVREGKAEDITGDTFLS